MDILDENFGETSPERDKIIQGLEMDCLYESSDIRKGRIALIALIILTAVSAVVGIKDGQDKNDMLIEVVFLLIIYGFAFWLSSSRPKIAFIVAFSAYFLMIAISAFIEPSTLFSGIVIKVVLIYFMGKAVLSSSKFEESRTELKKYGHELKVPSIF